MLDRADSLMQTHPDSALALLDAAGGQEAKESSSQGVRKTSLSMRYWLLKADALNKTYGMLPSDTLMKEVVEYYDRHGNANERMRAHYLLGRVYHDMGEAPKALECYQQAAEQADTTSADCDLYNLYAVYGQMANLYHKQYLPEYESQAFRQCEQIAWKDRDTLSALKAIELQISPSYLLGDTDKVLNLTNKVAILYHQYGYRNHAAAAYPVAIYIHIVRGEINEAKRLMDIFETESGLFDKNGEINKNNVYYYYIKGLYYTAIHELKRAEHLFRKVQDSGYPKEGCKGLLKVYSLREDIDSVTKYSLLYEEFLDSIHEQTKTEVILNIQGLYNYNKRALEAKQNKLELEQNKSRTTKIYVAIFFICCIFSFSFYCLLKKKESHYQYVFNRLVDVEAEKERLTEIMYEHEKYISEMQQQLEENTSSNQELLNMQEEQLRQKEVFQNEIALLSEQSQSLRKEISGMRHYKAKNLLYGNDTVQYFLKFKSPNILLKSPTRRDWTKLIKTFEQYLSEDKMFFEDFSENERKTYMLMELSIPNKNIASLLHISAPRVSQIKKQVQDKIGKQKVKQSKCL